MLYFDEVLDVTRFGFRPLKHRKFVDKLAGELLDCDLFFVDGGGVCFVLLSRLFSLLLFVLRCVCG